MKTYQVKYVNEPPGLDAKWDKPFWQSIEPIRIDQSHPNSSDFKPFVQAKMAYDEDMLYLIFRVEDKYVRAAATETHGQVWKDSCVEFFFSGRPNRPNTYFNVEINCRGVMLAQYHSGPRENSRYLDIEDCRKFKIASSLSGPVFDEIEKPLTWVLEYFLPLEVISKYDDFQKPAAGVTWNGNFYKCADGCSHPHWLSWSPVNSDKPDFHRPDCFGKLLFV